ncbi:MAG: hypothetical protein AAGA18_14780 [Verrucomicrobiota bacterium]
MKKKPKSPQDKVNEISDKLVDWLIEHENQHSKQTEKLQKLLRRLEQVSK